MNTPVLFIVFNRLDTAQRVFEKIKEAKPPRLYFACDGARNENEAIICNQVKALSKEVDWDCEVKTNFLSENLGPSKAPYKFIKWFFDNEEQGIILEHDCLPNTDFFVYCEDLLQRYKDNPSIGAISGTNFVPLDNDNKSYTFTIYNHIWGWATWRRTIDLYSLDLSNISEEDFQLILKHNFGTKIERAYWSTIFWQIKNGYIPTWDYYLTFCLWHNNLLSISPNVNLVSNIGFGEGAVNTTDADSPYASMQTNSILPLIYNKEIYPNRQQEIAYFNTAIMENKSSVRLYLKLALKRMGLFKYWMNIKRKLK